MYFQLESTTLTGTHSCTVGQIGDQLCLRRRHDGSASSSARSSYIPSSEQGEAVAKALRFNTTSKPERRADGMCEWNSGQQGNRKDNFLEHSNEE
jgi:hypothetical protein